LLYDDVATYLLAQSSLTTLVGNDIGPMSISDTATYPLITMQITDSDHIFMLGNSANIAKPIMRFQIHALTVEDCHNISQVLINLLHGFTGTMGSDEVKVLSFEGLSDPDPDLIEEDYIYHRWLHFKFACDLAII
jgi:hypothetical protein